MDFLLSAVILILTTILLLPFLKNYSKYKRISHYIDRLPGDKKYPVIGTAWTLMRAKREEFFDLCQTRHKKYGPITRIWSGQMPIVSIYKPEHAEVVFKSQAALDKGVMYDFLKPFLGEGLISGSGPKWKRHRKIITPSFHFQILDRYGEIFAEKSNQFARYLQRYEGKGYFEVTEILGRLGMDVISETAMGVKLDVLENPTGKGAEFAHSIIEFLTIFYKRVYNPFLRSDLIFYNTELGKKSVRSQKAIHEFNLNVIEKRKELLEAYQHDYEDEDEIGRKKRLSFLDLLLEHQANNPSFGDEEIEEEVNTFMFGGQDTTVATLTYSFLALGNHPEVLAKVHQELDEIFADDPDRKITPNDINEMKYLDRVLKEVLRNFTLAPMLNRSVKEDLIIGDHLIPKGVNISINLYQLHHDSDHWPDPFKFDPDRFLPENSLNRHPYAYVPFSAGARNCLGQKFAMRNVKTLLAGVLRKYTVTCQEKVEDIKYFLEIVIRPQNGLHIAIEKRR